MTSCESMERARSATEIEITRVGDDPNGPLCGVKASKLPSVQAPSFSRFSYMRAATRHSSRNDFRLAPCAASAIVGVATIGV
jgi:hypothetical protein